MNERIQQFAEQARTSVPAGLDTVEWIARYNEIFAELIIQECLDQLLISDPTEDFDKGVAWSARQIQNHFGVE